MKILLVYCNSMLENALPIGISQISACLKQAGFVVELFDTTFYRYGSRSDTENRIEALQFPPCPLNYKTTDMEDDFRSIIETYKPALIGFSIVEPTFKLGLRLLASATDIINRNNILVAFGGVHAILAPQTIMLHDNIDFICISEGENAFVELCNKIKSGDNYQNTAGFYIKAGDNWIMNQKAALVDINSMPILDFSIFGESYLAKPMLGKLYRTISIETTRGCPYHCTYCGDHALRKIYRDSGAWYREKKFETIERELDAYIAAYQPEFVYIMSESFLSGRLKKVEQFADMYRRFSIPFWFNTRPEDITDEKVKLIKEVGCARISIGLEHGNEKFRKEVLKRNYSNDTFVRACSILKKYGISFSVNLIIGFPDETRDMIFNSIDLLKEVAPDGISTHIYNPYHGSEMRHYCVQQKMIDEDLIAEDFFQGDYCLNNPTITKDEILGIFRTLPLYITLDRSVFAKILKAEDLTLMGNSQFLELSEQYYKVKGWDWNNRPVSTSGWFE